MRVRGYFSKSKGVRERRSLGNCSADICAVQGSVVVVQTRHGQDGPGFDLLVWARDFVFSAPVHTDPGSHPFSSILGAGAFCLG